MEDSAFSAILPGSSLFLDDLKTGMLSWKGKTMEIILLGRKSGAKLLNSAKVSDDLGCTQWRQ